MKATSKRQQQIIEVAGKLLIDKGIKGLTTKKLAEEIGFSESALYRHFRSKEDVIVFLLQYLEGNMKVRLQAIANNSEEPGIQLQEIFESQFQYFKENPHFVVAVLSEGLFNESETINQAISKIMHFKMDLLEQIVANGMQQDKILSTITKEEIVHILMGSFRLMLLKWKFSNFSLDIITAGNTMMKTNLKLFVL